MEIYRRNGTGAVAAAVAGPGNGKAATQIRKPLEHRTPRKRNRTPAKECSAAGAHTFAAGAGTEPLTPNSKCLATGTIRPSTGSERTAAGAAYILREDNSKDKGSLDKHRPPHSSPRQHGQAQEWREMREQFNAMREEINRLKVGDEGSPKPRLLATAAIGKDTGHAVVMLCKLDLLQIVRTLQATVDGLQRGNPGVRAILRDIRTVVQRQDSLFDPTSAM
ncbi:hypothetical protein Bbelb_240940 [Branchiostoma belcheri]|nr:hypothetical protein Bbelb_240940 [Branchiostoma belcheri]